MEADNEEFYKSDCNGKTQECQMICSDIAESKKLNGCTLDVRNTLGKDGILSNPIVKCNVYGAKKSVYPKSSGVKKLSARKIL